jgi:rhodanese-related sulfurtransferase
LSAGAALQLLQQGFRNVYIIMDPDPLIEGFSGLKKAGLTFVEGGKLYLFKDGKLVDLK